MRSIRLTDGTFAGRLIGKYGWSIGPTSGSRGAMTHREPSGSHASSSTSLHVDVHLRQLRSIVQMVNVNVANRIEQRLQAERSLTERVLVREIRELAARNGEARAVPRQDGQARAGTGQVGSPQSGQRQEGTHQAGPRQAGQTQQAGPRQAGTQQAGQRHDGQSQLTGPRQVVTPQPRSRQDEAAEAGQGRDMASRADSGQDGSLTPGQVVRREGAGTEALRSPANQLTHRTAQSSDQASREHGTGRAGQRPERQGETNAPRQPEGRNAQQARQEQDRPSVGRNEKSNESGVNQAGLSRDERPDSETVAQLLARQQPPRDSERRTDRRLIELARRIEAIDPAGNSPAAMSWIGNAAPIGTIFPMRAARNGEFSPRSLGGGIAERDEASRALRQATHWIRNQAWSVMPVLERATLPEHRSRTGPGIVYRTMRSLAAQDWNRLTVVERLRERLIPTRQTGRRGGDASPDRSTATGSPRFPLSFTDNTARAVAVAQAERGLAAWRRSGTAALEPLRPVRSLAPGVTRLPDDERLPIVAGARDSSSGSPLGPTARRSAAVEARQSDASVPRATIVWTSPGQATQPADSAIRGTSLASSASRTAHSEEEENIARGRATIVSAPMRRDEFLLVRALGQLARAGRLRERIEERHGLSSSGTTAATHAMPETVSRVATVARETHSERENSSATIVVRANEGGPRAAAPNAGTARAATPNARPVRAAAPIGQTVLRPIAAAGNGVPALVERVRKRAHEGLHAAGAAEQAMNRPSAASTAASGTQLGATRQEHRQVRQVRLSPREAGLEESGAPRREAATGTGATETVQPRAAASAVSSAVAEATSRGSATGGVASPELRHAAAAGPSAPAQGRASASRTSVMPVSAAPDRFASHRTAMKHAMRAQQPLRRGNPGETTAPRAASLTGQPTATTTHLASALETAREAAAAPTRAPATAQSRSATPVVAAAMAPLGLQVAGRHARAAIAAVVANPPAIGTPLVQAPAAAASRGQATRVSGAPGQAPDASIGPALVVPGIAPAAAVSRAPVDLPLARLDVPARAAERPGREEQAIRTLEVAVKTIEQELGQAKELWAKPKLDVNRLTDEMVKAVAKRMKQDRQRRGI